MPVEAVVAVHGEAEVWLLAEGSVVERDVARAGDHAVVVRLRSTVPADTLEVIALAPSVAGDVVLTSRPAVTGGSTSLPAQRSHS